jgi:hypothetical protein
MIFPSRAPLAGLLFAFASSLVGCSSSDDTTGHIGDAPGAPDASVADTGASTDAGSRDTGNGLDADDDGPADAADGGETGVAPDAGDAGGFPPPPGPVCNTTPSWGAGVLLSISTASDDELDAVTPDEMSIVWTAGAGSGATVEYADRASSTDPFGAPQTLAAGQFTNDRVALSQDGLRMVVVNADGQGFSELTRSSRLPPGNTFASPGVGTYGNLDAAGVLASGQSYGDPVLSADDRAFYYSVYGGGATATIFRTARLFAGDSWPGGAPVAGSSALSAQGAMRRRPTGISSDDQTLFFWDEVMGIERAAWIDESTGSFDVFVDLGTMTMAAPNAACSELYFSSAGASSVDLFAAPD